MQLAEDRHSPVQALAARADALMVHHQASTAAQIQRDGDAVFITAVSGGRPPGKKAPARPQPAQSGGGRKESAWEKMKICRFHYRYSTAATHCDAGCEFVAEN